MASQMGAQTTMRPGRKCQVAIDLAVKIQISGIVKRGTVLVGQTQNGHNLVSGLDIDPMEVDVSSSGRPVAGYRGKDPKEFLHRGRNHGWVLDQPSTMLGVISQVP